MISIIGRLTFPPPTVGLFCPFFLRGGQHNIAAINKKPSYPAFLYFCPIIMASSKLRVFNSDRGAIKDNQSAVCHFDKIIAALLTLIESSAAAAALLIWRKGLLNRAHKPRKRRTRAPSPFFFRKGSRR